MSHLLRVFDAALPYSESMFYWSESLRSSEKSFLQKRRVLLALRKLQPDPMPGTLGRTTSR